MSDGITLKVSTEPLQKLLDVMADYMTLTGKDAQAALQKAAREVDFAMFKESREQPPRPIQGDILAAAKSRGYTVATNDDGYVTGYQQALRILSGFKSGYFRIGQKNGRVTVDPVFLGPVQRSQMPADARKLNLGALATIFALNQRQKAASGGYMSTEFLTFRALNRGNISAATFYTKNRKAIGAVKPEPTRVTITGNMEHANSIAQKYGLIDKAFSRGADTYRTDMYAYVVKKAQQTLAKLGQS